MNKSQQQITAFVFGVVFVAAMLVIAFEFPTPTPFQYTVFRIVLALAAAGVAAMIPGFIEFHIPTWIRAGGALAVFAIVFFRNPATLISETLDPNYIDMGIDKDTPLTAIVGGLETARNVTINFSSTCGSTVRGAVIAKGDHEGDSIQEFLQNLLQRIKGSDIAFHVYKKGDRRYEIACP